MVPYALRPGLSEMEDTHMEQRGTKSGERQRMRNLLLSRDRLARTLAANFTGGDLLVALTYQAGPRPRSRELARQQVRQWIGSISGLRRAQGMAAKYVYLLGTEQAGSLVHRVILNRGREPASMLGHPWPYGPVYVSPLDLSQQGQALASELLRQPLQVGHSPLPCARLWVSSRGIHHT